MAFDCDLTRTQAKVFNPWYARSLLDGAITLQDLFFASSLLENLTM